MTSRPRPSKYHRRQLGGGNALRAVTRARRSAPSRLICGVENMKPPVWRAELRKQREAREAPALIESLIEQWHDAQPGDEAYGMELHEWLGWTRQQYAAWIESTEAETMAILADPETMAAIAEGEAELEAA